MKVRDIMSPGVQTAQPEDSVRDVAQSMADLDIGSMPVCDGQTLLGMITDRDIALRIVGKGLSSSTPVHETMTREVQYCLADDDVEDVARKMGQLQVRRLPVLDESRRLIGIVAMGDLAAEDKPRRVGETLGEISESRRH